MQIYSMIKMKVSQQESSAVYEIFAKEKLGLLVTTSVNGVIKLFDISNLRLIASRVIHQNVVNVQIEEKNEIFFYNNKREMIACCLKTFKVLSSIRIGEKITDFDIYCEKKGQDIFLVINDEKYGFIVALFDLFNNQFDDDKVCYMDRMINSFKLEKNKIMTFQENILEIWNLKQIKFDNQDINPLSSHQFNQNYDGVLHNNTHNILLFYNKYGHYFYKINEDNLEEIFGFNYITFDYNEEEIQHVICFHQDYCLIGVNVTQIEDEEIVHEENFILHLYKISSSQNQVNIKGINHNFCDQILKRNVNVITANEYFSSFFVLGDQEGKVVVLDLEKLQILNIQKENSNHLQEILHDNPIQEAVFVNYGRDVLVGTIYGSISLYSSKINMEPYYLVPKEQFFKHEFIEGEEDTYFCNSSLVKHEEPFDEGNSVLKYMSENQKEMQNVKNFIWNQNSQKNFLFENREEKFKNLVIPQKPKEYTLYEFQLNDQKNQEEFPISKRRKIIMSEDEELTEKKPSPIKTRRLARKRRKIIVSESDLSESNSYFTKKTTPSKSQDKDFEVCFYCNQFINKITQCAQCLKKCCENCHQDYYPLNKNQCLLCYWKSKTENLEENFYSENKHCSRINYQDCKGTHFDYQEKFLSVFPQVGVKYYLIDYLCLKFLREYYQLINPTIAIEMFNFLMNNQKDTLIEIEGIEYVFPYAKIDNNYKFFQKRKQWQIQMHLSCISKDQQLTIPFVMGLKNDCFLIPFDIYQKGLSKIRIIRENQAIEYNGGKYFVKKIFSLNKLSFSLSLINLQGKRISRIKSNGEEQRGHGWLINISQTMLKNVKNFNLKNIWRNFQNIYYNNEELYWYFKENVDFKEFPNYKFCVPFQMNLNRIKNRLKQSFYEDDLQLNHDIMQILVNCKIFNDESSDIVKNCTQLTKELLYCVQQQNKQPRRSLRLQKLYHNQL